jgi:GntR family transcriptional regulator, transcriptional repressor for pyruvate dehydrogenase complex
MTTPATRSDVVQPEERAAARRVVEHVRELIFTGGLVKGARLSTERELVAHLRVSRTSVRAGLQSLVSKGVLVARRGAGTFVADDLHMLDSEALGCFAALHGLSRREMFEARRTLEAGVAGLAAERASGEMLAAISDTVTGMFSSLDDPQTFLRWDIKFHRAVAAASGNRVIASMVEMISALFYEQRRQTADRDRDLKAVATMHFQIYQAIRDRQRALAGHLMNQHLLEAERLQDAEEAAKAD